MSQFRIRADQSAFKINFQATPAQASAPESEAQSVVPATVGSAAPKSEPPAKDQLRLVGGSSAQAKAKPSLDIFEGENTSEANAPQTFMERITTRHSGVSVGSEDVQLAMEVESQAPEILTSAHEPSLAESLKTRLQSSGEESGSTRQDVVRTGASIQTSETVQLNVGMASLVNTHELMGKGAPADKMQHGMYAGVAVKTETLSSRVAVDNAFGSPRVEVGAALTDRNESVTLGVSLSQGAVPEQNGIRVGVEVKTGPDSVLGVNINKAAKDGAQANSESTSLGVYLNTRFD